ncbi:MAG TPA: type II secretion system protein [Candidatus Eremiobacteraceae bacterium]|nr:type II secretion system protein [Candidatus Eremiobacteraceae bacterium]
MRRRQRAFSVVEVLTVLVIVGLILAAIAITAPLFLNAQNEVQAQTDNINSAALALYRVQRDVRQSDVNGVFNCTTAPVVLCSQTGGNAVTTQALAIITADNGTGEFQPITTGAAAGQPDWQGFWYYWLVPDPNGQSNDLLREYENTGPINLTTASLPSVELLAQTWLTTALGGSPETVATNVESLSAAADTGDSIVQLQLVGGGTSSGNVTSLSLSGSSYVRN